MTIVFLQSPVVGPSLLDPQHTESLANAVLDSAPCCFTPAVDSTLLDGLARDARQIVDAPGKNVSYVSAIHAISLAGANVGSRDVLAGSMYSLRISSAVKRRVIFRVALRCIYADSF
jgi:hypothetical protein